jgi:hypothetical protein
MFQLPPASVTGLHFIPSMLNLISYHIVETMLRIPACSFLLVLHYYLYTFGAVLMWSIRTILVAIRILEL